MKKVYMLCICEQEALGVWYSRVLPISSIYLSIYLSTYLYNTYMY